uniref:Uncharacterized LOC100177044 n=1 Tax=Ciona intestinalis TaxID=7719 RepID=F6SRI6_CIOIN|nr:uncharacterized protein LOC100177044 [Ciona intestinalis]|eukprot:XP_002128438.1 uncharacterized protein LOC100177044 [Ciona intestinalis]
MIVESKKVLLNGRYLYPHDNARDDVDNTVMSSSNDVTHPEVEYIRSRCYLVTYFKGHPRDKVDEHFNRSLRHRDDKPINDVTAHNDKTTGETPDHVTITGDFPNDLDWLEDWCNVTQPTNEVHGKH